LGRGRFNGLITIKVAPLLFKAFILFVLLISVVSFHAKAFSVLGIGIAYTDILLMSTFILLIPMYFKNTIGTIASKLSITLLYFILFYSFTSTLWGKGDYKFIFYQLILALLTVSIPYLISKIVNDKHIDFHKLISNFSLVLTIVLFFLYV